VANIDSEIKELIGQSIFWNAEEAGDTFKRFLKLFVRGKFKENSSGRYVESTAGNGHQVSFIIPEAADGLNPRNLTALAMELYKSFESSHADLVTSGIATPTDTQVWTEMQQRLEEVPSFTKSYVNLRA